MLGSRILVQESIYDQFLEKFKRRAEENKVGDLMNPQAFQGSQIPQLQFNRIMGYINQGKQDGAKVIAGADRLGSQGYYIRPALFLM